MLDPIGLLHTIDTEKLHDNLAVNLTAPVMLTTHFVQKVSSWDCRRMVVGITSGAGRHAYKGLAGYCIAKAGLNMLTECVGAEQNGEVKTGQVLDIR